MYFMILQLFDTKYKDDIFLAFTTCNIKKASYFEGYNLDKMLAQDFVLFHGFFPTRDTKERFSILITALVEDKKQVENLYDILKEAGIDPSNIMRTILIPVESVIE